MDIGRSKKCNIRFIFRKTKLYNKLITSLEIDGNIIKKSSKISETQTDYYKILYSERLNERYPNYPSSLNECLFRKQWHKNNYWTKLFCYKPIGDPEILIFVYRKHEQWKIVDSDCLHTDFNNYL